MERITSLEAVPEGGSVLFTVREANGDLEEVILVRTGDGVAAWKNFCQHEIDQRLDGGQGVAMRNSQIVCPRHGSMFDVETGYCDVGPAEGSTLVEVGVTVQRGDVFLTDDDAEFLHVGGIDDDGTPDSTSHLTF